LKRGAAIHSPGGRAALLSPRFRAEHPDRVAAYVTFSAAIVHRVEQRCAGSRSRVLGRRASLVPRAGAGRSCCTASGRDEPAAPRRCARRGVTGRNARRRRHGPRRAARANGGERPAARRLGGPSTPARTRPAAGALDALGESLTRPFSCPRHAAATRATCCGVGHSEGETFGRDPCPIGVCGVAWPVTDGVPHSGDNKKAAGGVVGEGTLARVRTHVRRRRPCRADRQRSPEGRRRHSSLDGPRLPRSASRSAPGRKKPCPVRGRDRERMRIRAQARGHGGARPSC